MATVPNSYLEALTKALDTLSARTQRVAIEQIKGITYTNIAEFRDQVIAILGPLFAVATDEAASFAAVMYDEIRELNTGEQFGASAYSGYKQGATNGAVKALVSRVESAGLQSFLTGISQRCDLEIKQAAAESVVYNSVLDPKSTGYARVPQGQATCGFCLMLASFGYRYEDRGKIKHVHPNCDCRIVPWFEGMSVKDYDPDGMYDRFNQCLDSLGGNKGIHDMWDALPEGERNAYLERHHNRTSQAFTAFKNNRLSEAISASGAEWFRFGM